MAITRIAMPAATSTMPDGGEDEMRLNDAYLELVENGSEKQDKPRDAEDDTYESCCSFVVFRWLQRYGCCILSEQRVDE
jgi:hypothetical protein